jgi:hypothetical protein
MVTCPAFARHIDRSCRHILAVVIVSGANHLVNVDCLDRAATLSTYLSCHPFPHDCSLAILSGDDFDPAAYCSWLASKFLGAYRAHAAFFLAPSPML